MLKIVTTKERPDLVDVTGPWRWQAFFSDGSVLQSDLMVLEADCAKAEDFIPTVFVLLDDEAPVAMVAICVDDLEGRPELNPWLAGLYVEPSHRGKGHARLLIDHLERAAQGAGLSHLSLYTSDAVDLYRKAGWHAAEQFEQDGKTYHIMRKAIAG